MVRIVSLLALAAMALAPPALAQTRPAPAATASNLIDLNNASRDDLMTLDGIGEVRADAIIRSRPFKAKTELVERRLIPEHLYDKIADKVMARPPPGPAPTPGRPPPQKRS
ncbi:helix-hairpin-helix domain-containing protein [Reyranella sp.]|uniref:ComEA family DNA-binding protein n=1 Tax=Reyranella sp. TaxID=1929291 RepID=UPI00273099DE|nr:helix-hairpin-helix domain-containing protein [Reyranella sp.]MDP2373826.1 helix-hairpin-helix domain-containing protein [Reyranella sp.]